MNRRQFIAGLMASAAAPPVLPRVEADLSTFYHIMWEQSDWRALATLAPGRVYETMLGEWGGLVIREIPPEEFYHK